MFFLSLPTQILNPWSACVLRKPEYSTRLGFDPEDNVDPCLPLSFCIDAEGN